MKTEENEEKQGEKGTKFKTTSRERIKNTKKREKENRKKKNKNIN